MWLSIPWGHGPAFFIGQQLGDKRKWRIIVNLLKFSLGAASLEYHSVLQHCNETLKKTNLKRECSFWCMVLIGSIVSKSVVRQSISIERYDRITRLTCGRQQGKGPGVSYHLKSTAHLAYVDPILTSVIFQQYKQLRSRYHSKHEPLENILDTYYNNQFCRILLIK